MITHPTDQDLSLVAIHLGFRPVSLTRPVSLATLLTGQRVPPHILALSRPGP